MLGKEFPAFQSLLKRRSSPQERLEEIQGHATISRVPQMSQSIPGKPVFPALFRLSSRGSTHIMVARGTALWESLVGKPRGNPLGKPSRESHRSMIHANGSATVLPHLGRKAHVLAPTRERPDSPGETPEVPQDPCQHWREILRYRHRIHTKS